MATLIFPRNEPPNPAKYFSERPEMTSRDGKSRKAKTRKIPNQKKEQKVKSLKFFKPTLATTLAIVLAWLLSVRPAQAGYTVTLQQVGPDVVATGSGPINLTGLTFSQSFSVNPGIRAERVPSGVSSLIYTGPTSSSVDSYFGATGPTSFGSFPFIFVTSANSGSGTMVGISAGLEGIVIIVPTGYVSGTALSDRATYNGTTLEQLHVTPGTYVWKWGTGANQNFTLKILTASRLETESLKVAAKTPPPNGITPAQWFGVFNAIAASGGAGTYFNATAPGQFITYTVPVARAGTYHVKVGIQTKPNKGTFRLAINGARQGAVQDEYNASVGYGVRDLGTVYLNSGNQAFKFTVAGKNANSTGYTLAFDYVELLPVQ